MGCTLTIGAKIVPFRSLLVPNTTRAESALVEQRHKCLHNAEFSSALRQFAASGHHSVNTNNACSATLPGAEQTETLGEKRQKGPVGLTSLCSAAPLPFTSTFSPNSKFNNWHANQIVPTMSGRLRWSWGEKTTWKHLGTQTRRRTIRTSQRWSDLLSPLRFEHCDGLYLNWESCSPVQLSLRFKVNINVLFPQFAVGPKVFYLWPKLQTELDMWEHLRTNTTSADQGWIYKGC